MSGTANAIFIFTDGRMRSGLSLVGWGAGVLLLGYSWNDLVSRRGTAAYGVERPDLPYRTAS